MANVTAGSLISLTARLGEDAAICLKPESSEELVKKAHIARTVSKTAQRRIRSSVISFLLFPLPHKVLPKARQAPRRYRHSCGG